MSHPIQAFKIRFEPEQAIEKQIELLQHGYIFDTQNQHPRPCYGVVVRGNVMQAIGSEGTWKAMQAAEVNEVKPFVVRTPKPVREKISRAERRKIAIQANLSCKEKIEQTTQELTGIVAQALINIGQHEPNLFGTNSRSQARKVAWIAFISECVKLYGKQPSENTLRNAIRRVFLARGERYMIPDPETNREVMKNVKL